MISPFTAALVYAAAAGLAARQIVKAWGSISWQVDVAAGLGAVPVLAALAGPGWLPSPWSWWASSRSAAPLPRRGPVARRRWTPGGRRDPVPVRRPRPGRGLVRARAQRVDRGGRRVLGLVGAYEAGDYIVGSGACNSLEGPLAGITASTLLALPWRSSWSSPSTPQGVVLLGFTAVACPLGQIVASAALPGAGVPALRRLNTLIVLAPLWAAPPAPLLTPAAREPRPWPGSRGELPVHQVAEPRLDVGGAGVLVVEVVGVLPHVQGEQRRHAVLEGQVGVLGLDDVQPTVARDQPCPPRAEQGRPPVG